MPPHRPWLKTWISLLTDPDFDALTLQDQARWLRLFLYVGANGERGQLVLKEGLDPSRTGSGSISNLFRLRFAKQTREALGRLPNVVVEDAQFPSTETTITFTKWAKYQEDNSQERLRKHRRSKAERNADSPFPETPTDRFKRPLGNGSRGEEKRIPLTPRERGTNPRAQGTNPRALDQTRQPRHPYDTTPLDADPTNPEHFRFNIPD